jgi:hypothetical protein
MAQFVVNRKFFFCFAWTPDLVVVALARDPHDDNPAQHFV